MTTIRGSVAAQSKALADAADEILNQPKVPERRYVPLTSAEAVLRYAGDFIPSWAGAISIDLLPAVLVGIMAVVHGAMRRGEDEMEEADRITAGDMIRSLRYSELLKAQRPAEHRTCRCSEPGDEAGMGAMPGELRARRGGAAAKTSRRCRYPTANGPIHDDWTRSAEGRARRRSARRAIEFVRPLCLAFRRWRDHPLGVSRHVVGTIIVLGLDLRDLGCRQWLGFDECGDGARQPSRFSRLLLRSTRRRASTIRDHSSRPMMGCWASLWTFSLESGGRLKAEGTIDPGTAEQVRRRNRGAGRICEDRVAEFARRRVGRCDGHGAAPPRAWPGHRDRRWGALRVVLPAGARRRQTSRGRAEGGGRRPPVLRGKPNNRWSQNK